MMNRRKIYRPLLAALCSLCILCGCSKDDDPPAPAPKPIPTSIGKCFKDGALVISNISGIPAGVTFNKVSAEVSGDDWQIVDLVETSYDGKETVLVLPLSIPDVRLMKVVRDNASDYTGFWRADTDNANAKVAELQDIFAYSGGRRVGRIFLTEWLSGSTVGKPFVKFQYANEPFELTGTYGSYRFVDASFGAGWNAYAMVNITMDAVAGAVKCTTDIPEDTQLYWRFESYE